MLILRRKEGQWLEIRHRSGDVIRVRVCNIRARFPGQLDLALDDPAHNFEIHRPERAPRPEAPAPAPAPFGHEEPALETPPVLGAPAGLC
ncbi:MAG: hypothetical protein U0835_01640 [Isosphaeraceae bacterium]